MNTVSAVSASAPVVRPLDEERLHYMDNLRALAMLAGVVFHAGLAHSVLMHRFWPTADAGQSVVIDAFAWFSHLFRMPLFFVVAGFFVALLVHKRGVGGMLGNRFMRVLLPFIVFWPIVYLSMGWLISHAVATVEHPSPLLAMLKPWFDNPNRSATPPMLGHLWFLPYLMCFCILVWVVCALEIRAPRRWFAALLSGTSARLVLLVPLVLALPLVAVPAPHPAPESLFPQWWALMFYGMYFVLGYQLFHHENLLDRLSRMAPFMLLAALVSYALFLYLLRSQSLANPNPLTHLAMAALAAYTGCWMTLVCLVLGKRWLNFSNRLLRYVADASYWVYIVHLPVLFAIQFRLMDTNLNWWLKSGIATCTTLGIAFASYQLLVRNTVVGRLLNGPRRNERSATSTVTSTTVSTSSSGSIGDSV